MCYVLICDTVTRRAIVTAQKALLFEPYSAATRKFADIVIPHLGARVGEGRGGSVGGSSSSRGAGPQGQGGLLGAGDAQGGSSGGVGAESHTEYMSRFYQKNEQQMRAPPFELEVLEWALLVATGECLNIDQPPAVAVKKWSVQHIYQSISCNTYTGEIGHHCLTLLHTIVLVAFDCMSLLIYHL